MAFNIFRKSQPQPETEFDDHFMTDAELDSFSEHHGYDPRSVTVETIQKSEENLQDAFNNFVDTGIVGSRHTRDIDHFRSRVYECTEVFINAQVAQTLPLSQDVLTRSRLLQASLLAIADECAAQRNTGESLLTARLRVMFEYELEALDALHMICAVSFIDTPGGFWQRTNVLVQDIVKEDQFEVRSDATEFLVTEGKHVTAKTRYLSMLMLALAKPKQLGVADAIRVRTLVSHHMKTIQIGNTLENPTQLSGRIIMMIDSLANVPAMPCPITKVASLGDGAMLLDTTELVQAISKHYSKLAKGENTGFGLIDGENAKRFGVLLKQLVINWGKSPIRQQPRTEAERNVRLLSGFDVISKHINELIDIADARDGRATLSDIQSTPAPMLKAEILDESATGMRLRITSSATPMEVGEIICVTVESTGFIDFVPCLVRWIGAVSAEQFEMGMVKIGQSIHAADLKAVKVDAKMKPVSALIVGADTDASRSGYRIVTQEKTLDRTVRMGFKYDSRTSEIRKLRPILETTSITTYKCDVIPRGSQTEEAAPVPMTA